MEEKRSRRPVILDLSEQALPEAPSPAEAPPIGDTVPPGAAERALAAARRRRRGSALGRIFWSALGGLVALGLAITVEGFLRGLFAREDWLGWLGLGLVGAVALSLIGLALRELAGLARLERIERYRRDARRAAEAEDGDAAANVLAGLSALYARRPELELAARRMDDALGDTPGAAERIELAERVWMAPLDAASERVIARAARDVAGATAMIPIPVIDVLAVLLINLRMIRGIAEVYGGRSGWLESWRLLRAVAAHLAATGVIAATDDLIGPLVGGSVLAKLSRRFGEATVNAALTVRVGVAAAEVCRPLPFEALRRPSPRRALSRALKDWQDRTEAPE